MSKMLLLTLNEQEEKVIDKIIVDGSLISLYADMMKQSFCPLRIKIMYT